MIVSVSASALAAAVWLRCVRGTSTPSSRADESPPPEGGDPFGQLRELSVELEETVDRKVGELRGLIERAEAATERLERLLEEGGRESAALRAGAPGGRLPGPQEAGAAFSRERIAELHREGMKVEAIASAVGLPRGEVELILSLEKR